MARIERRSRSDMIALALEEALRMRRFPGLCFMDHPSGRHAHIQGARPAAWEILWLFDQFRRDERKFAKLHPHLAPGPLRTALAYEAVYPGEIREAIRERDRFEKEMLAGRIPWIRPAGKHG